METRDKRTHPDEDRVKTNLTLDPCDMAAFETWLEDRAGEGWELDSIGPRLTDFRGAPPAHVRYRLTPLPRKEQKPAADFLDMAAVCGWEYVATVNNAFHLWRCGDPAAPEMENDPVAQAEGYRYIARRMTRNLALTVGLILLLALLLWTLRSETPLLALARMPLFWLPGAALYFGWGLGTAIHQWQRMRRTLKKLRAGIPMDRPVAWKRARLAQRITLFAGVPLYLLLVFGRNFADGRNIADRPAAMAEARYVDITRLDPDLEGDVEFWSAETKRTEVFPRIYKVEQVEWVPRGGSGWYSNTTAETEYYRLWTEGMAAEVELELTKQYERYWNGNTEVLPAPELDSFRWCRYDSGDEQYALARLGNAVLHVRYAGKADLREHTAYLAELLQ